MDAEKTINYWLEGSAYDLATGTTLLRSKRYPYALFFGHLAIEKLLKGVVVKHTGKHAPYTHSLIMLAGQTGIDLPAEKLDILAEIMEFHTEARYPDIKMEFYQKCSREFAREKFAIVRKTYSWIRKKSGI
jgi:HEPN domain-containing protein